MNSYGDLSDNVVIGILDYYKNGEFAKNEDVKHQSQKHRSKKSEIKKKFKNAFNNDKHLWEIISSLVKVAEEKSENNLLEDKCEENRKLKIKLKDWEHQYSGQNLKHFLTAETDHFKNHLEIDLRKEFEEEYSDSEFKRQNERQSNLIRNLRFELHAKNSQLDNLPTEIIDRILKASSFKLNWILDPFARTGSIGIAAKKMGRRFIGFEMNKDKLILAMKRIDSEEK